LAGRAENTKPALRVHWVSQRERHATRESLIEVARLIVERDGEPALTLGAVADEAGLARATVYGFFSGRKELLEALDPSRPEPRPAVQPEPELDEPAIWANCEPDLSAFLPEDGAAAEMPDTTETQDPPAAEDPVPAEAAVEAEADPAHDGGQASEEPVAEPAAEVSDLPDEDEPASQDERRRLQAAHLEEIAKRLILPESALREGTDAVIGRLDTRIRVLEKSISGLETRQTAAEAEAPRRIRAVTDMVDRLERRADVTDDKQLKTVSELRLGIHQLQSRVAALEASSGIAAAPAWSEPAIELPAAADSAPETVVAAAPEDDAEDGDENARHSYLSTVRTLAKEGARQAEERETAYEIERQTRRRRLIGAACVAAVSLGVIGVLFLLRPGTHGVSIAQSRTGPAPVHASLAPLDRLSALAQKGNDDAELLVGLKYLQTNDALAARWLARAAGRNNAVAENALGALYQSGRGVKADAAKAAALYQAAAAQGNRHAMSNLAVLYAAGNDRNFADAARWFQRSAALGYVDAQFNLAVLYERGDGVPQSLLDAYKWYAVAATSGDAVAKTRADAIATQLSADELAAAQKAALEFKPAPLNRAANDVPALATVLAAR
jgi:TPR repeat protein